MSSLQNQVVVHAGLYDQLLNEHAALSARVAELQSEKDGLRKALYQIADHDGRDDNGVCDEWAEAEAFDECQRIARQALAAKEGE